MRLFGWYGNHPGFCFDPGEGGGGTATAPAPASSEGGVINAIAGGGVADDEISAEALGSQIQEHAKEVRQRAEAERSDRESGKRVKSDGDSIAPLVGPTKQPRRRDGTYAKITPAQRAAANAGGEKGTENGHASNGQAANGQAGKAQQQPNGIPAAGLTPPPGTRGLHEPPAVAAPAQNGFTDQHFQVGAAYGLTKQQVESFGSAGTFEGWAVRMRGMIPRQQVPQQQWGMQPAPSQLQPHPQIGQQPPQQAPNQQQAAPFQYKPFSFENADDFDPQLLKLAEHANGVHQQVLGQLAPVLQVLPQLLGMAREFQGFRQAEQQRQQATLRQQMHESFGAVDKELFGEGDDSKVEQTQLNARIRASDVMAGLEMHYLRKGEALPPLKTLVEQARAMAFPDRVRAQVLAEASGKSQQLRSAATAVPTSRTPAPLGDTDRAIAAISAFQRENPPD